MQQREMTIVGAVRKPQLAPAELIAQCRNRMDAIRLCVQLSGLSNNYLCERLGIDPGHWTRIMQGRAHFPDALSVDLMTVCGNYAPMQYEALATGFKLVERPDERIATLERELAELRGVA